MIDATFEPSADEELERLTGWIWANIPHEIGASHFDYGDAPVDVAIRLMAENRALKFRLLRIRNVIKRNSEHGTSDVLRIIDDFFNGGMDWSDLTHEGS